MTPTDAPDADPHAPPEEAGSPAASLRPKTLALAELAIARAMEALRADAKAAEAASRVVERLLGAHLALGRAPASAGEAAPDLDDALQLEEERGTLLQRIDDALAGARTACRHEVEALIARGVDPREGWFWDAEDGDWIWNPGAILAQAAYDTAVRQETRAVDRAEDTLSDKNPPTDLS